MKDNTFRTLSYDFAKAEQHKSFINIGPVPKDEQCTEAGRNLVDGKLECEVYIKQLIRIYGEPPPDCEFFVMENCRDCPGNYYDVNIFYGVPSQEPEKYPGPLTEDIVAWGQFEKMWSENMNYV